MIVRGHIVCRLIVGYPTTPPTSANLLSRHVTARRRSGTAVAVVAVVAAHTAAKFAVGTAVSRAGAPLLLLKTLLFFRGLAAVFAVDTVVPCAAKACCFCCCCCSRFFLLLLLLLLVEWQLLRLLVLLRLVVGSESGAIE